MAITNKVIQGYLHRIIELRKFILPKLTQEVNTLGDKLGVGTFRAAAYPDLKVEVKGPKAGGYVTSWKAVVEALAIQYDIPTSVIKAKQRKYSSYKGPSGSSVTVSRDTVKNRESLVQY